MLSGALVLRRPEAVSKDGGVIHNLNTRTQQPAKDKP